MTVFQPNVLPSFFADSLTFRSSNSLAILMLALGLKLASKQATSVDGSIARNWWSREREKSKLAGWSQLFARDGFKHLVWDQREYHAV
jgi:hypothetical protein